MELEAKEKKIISRKILLNMRSRGKNGRIWKYGKEFREKDRSMVTRQEMDNWMWSQNSKCSSDWKKKKDTWRERLQHVPSKRRHTPARSHSLSTEIDHGFPPWKLQNLTGHLKQTKCGRKYM
jgi:hypothetical protein